VCLRRLRAGLRENMRRLPLCDAPAYTRAREDIYRGIWSEWCLHGAAEPQLAGIADRDRGQDLLPR